MGVIDKQHCTILPENESYKGMLQKVKDYVTWGEINQTLLKRLLKEKCLLDKADIDNAVADLMKNKKKMKDITNPTIRLHPPHRGYAGVKKPQHMGGSLGYRGKDINKLLERML